MIEFPSSPPFANSQSVERRLSIEVQLEQNPVFMEDRVHSFCNPKFNFVSHNPVPCSDALTLNKEDLPSLQEKIHGLIFKLTTLSYICLIKDKENLWLDEKKSKQLEELGTGLNNTKTSFSKLNAHIDQLKKEIAKIFQVRFHNKALN